MEKIISLIIYIVVFYFAFAGTRYTRNEKSLIKKIIPWLPLIILFTFRLDVGTDYYNYYRIVGRVPDINLLSFLSSSGVIEIGQSLISWTSKFFNNYNVFLFLNISIMLIFFYYAIRELQNKKVYALSFFMFLTLFFLTGLNISYQFIAIGCILISYKYVLERKFLKFLLTILLASLFHNTAMLIIPIYFIWSKKQSGWYYVYIIIFITLFSLVVLNYQDILATGILGDYEMYAEASKQGANRDIYIKILILISVLVLAKPLIKLDHNNKFYIILLVLGVIIGLTGFSSPFVKRIGLYFDITQILILPQICLLFYGNQKKIVYIILVWASLAYLILVYYILGSANVFPYKFGILGW